MPRDYSIVDKDDKYFYAITASGNKHKVPIEMQNEQEYDKYLNEYRKAQELKEDEPQQMQGPERTPIQKYLQENSLAKYPNMETVNVPNVPVGLGENLKEFGKAAYGGLQRVADATVSGIGRALNPVGSAYADVERAAQEANKMPEGYKEYAQRMGFPIPEEELKKEPKGNTAAETPTGPANVFYAGASGRPDPYAGDLQDVTRTLKSGLDKQREGAKTSYEAEQKFRADESAGLTDLSTKLQARMEAAQAKDEAFNTDMENEIKEYKEDLERVSNLEVDPRKWWNGKNTYEKVGAALAIMASSIGQSMQGRGGNPAMDIIQKQIDEDIDAQKNNIQNQRENIRDKNSFMRLRLQKHGDMRRAELETRAAMIEMVKTKIMGMASKAKSEQARGEYMKVIGTLDRQAALDKAGVIKIASDAASKRANLYGDTYVQGLGYATDKDSAKKARELKASYANYTAKLQTVKKLIDKYGQRELLGRVFSGAGSEIDAAHIAAVEAYMDFNEKAGRGKYKFDQASDAIPKVGTFVPYPSYKNVKIEKMINDADQTFNTKVNSYLRKPMQFKQGTGVQSFQKGKIE